MDAKDDCSHICEDTVMTFEFGETEESNAFFDRSPSFVPFFEKLMATANKCFGRRVNFKNHLEDVVFSQGHTCCDDYTEVVFLAVNGHANAAAKVFRGLYERAVTLAYIGDKFARRRNGQVPILVDLPAKSPRSVLGNRLLHSSYSSLSNPLHLCDLESFSSPGRAFCCDGASDDGLGDPATAGSDAFWSTTQLSLP